MAKKEDKVVEETVDIVDEIVKLRETQFDKTHALIKAIEKFNEENAQLEQEILDKRRVFGGHPSAVDSKLPTKVNVNSVVVRSIIGEAKDLTKRYSNRFKAL